MAGRGQYLSKEGEAFAQAYAQTRDLALSVKRAGIFAGNGANAEKVGLGWLGRPAVAARIADLTERPIYAHDVTLDRTLSELATVAYSNIDDYISVNEINGLTKIALHRSSRQMRAAISEVKVEELSPRKQEKAKSRVQRRITFRLHDKLTALITLGKHQGMVTGTSDVNINLDLALRLDEALKIVGSKRTDAATQQIVDMTAEGDSNAQVFAPPKEVIPDSPNGPETMGLAITPNDD